MERGEDEDTAEEIAARTVNKERARAGEAKESSAVRPMTSRRAGAVVCVPTRCGWSDAGPALQRSSPKGIAGRSKMNKAELERAVGR